MQQAPQQPTELTELEKIILKDQLKRHLRAEDALSFPPRTVGLALAVTFAFFVNGNRVKEHSLSSWGPSLCVLLIGFVLYSWSLVNRYNLAKRELHQTLVKFGVRPISEETLYSHDLPLIVVGFSAIVAVLLGALLFIKQ